MQNGKTPAYYKNNAKEIVKLLKVVPEAPRTSLKLLPSWNWPLLRSNDSLPTTLAPLSPRRVLEENASFNQSNGSENEKVSLEEEKTDEEKKVDEEQKNSTGSLTSLSKISREEKSDGKREPKSHENFNEKSKSFDEPIAKEEFKETDVPFLTENAKRLSVESTEQENQTGDYFEIWTNGNEAESGTVEAKSFKTDDTQKDENVGDDYTTNTANENDLEELHDAEENGEEKENESVAYLNVRTEETEERNANEENLEKTKWEIGVERQRLLDEGLLKVEDEDEENTEHADDVDRMIDEGDVEALATMVLNGEGDKLLGKNSTKAEVQVFLENLPSYLVII